MTKKNVRALGLLSGGLDSILAVKVIQQQGIEVIGLSFITPFFGPELAQKAARALQIKLIVEDITAEHFEIVKNPPHGYGKTMNPCIDCHAVMLKIAGRKMKELEAGFIFTGEVLDERPMSQNRVSLNVVAQDSQYKDYVLRPLSAKLLEPTLPEKQGLVDREGLLDIRGRSRKRQMELAEKFGVGEYPNPAGGCLLTDRNFSRRLKELFDFDADPNIRDVRLLRVGRHYRLGPRMKLIVGRNEKENSLLENFCRETDYLLKVGSVPGPSCLLTGEPNRETLEEASMVCAAYSDTDDQSRATVAVKNGEKKFEIEVITDKTVRDKKRIN